MCRAEPPNLLRLCHTREEPWAGRAGRPCPWGRDLGCFSPSWGGQGVRCRAAAQRPSLHPPARPAPCSPRLFPSAAAAFALIYISTQLQSRAPSPAGEEGQDRDGEITRGGGEGHPPAGRAAFLGGGWCLRPSSAPSVRPGTPHTPLWGSRGALVTPQLRAPQILLHPRRGAGGCSPRGTRTAAHAAEPPPPARISGGFQALR